MGIYVNTGMVRDWLYPHACLLCEYGWKSLEERPQSCPKCYSRRWDIALTGDENATQFSLERVVDGLEQLRDRVRTLEILLETSYREVDDMFAALENVSDVRAAYHGEKRKRQPRLAGGVQIGTTNT